MHSRIHKVSEQSWQDVLFIHSSIVSIDGQALVPRGVDCANNSRAHAYVLPCALSCTQQHTFRNTHSRAHTGGTDHVFVCASIFILR